MPRRGTGKLVNREELAHIFGVAVNTITAWLKQGLPFVEEGREGKAWQFNTADVIAWRVDSVRERVGPKGAANFDEERARKMQADADMAEIERDRARGSVVEVCVIAEAVRREYATVRTRFGALPGSLAPRLDVERALEFQPVIAAAVDEILTELSADGELESREAAGGDGPTADDPPSGDEAGSAPEPDRVG